MAPRPLQLLLVQGTPQDHQTLSALLASRMGAIAMLAWEPSPADALEALASGRYDLAIVSDGGRPAETLELVRAAGRLEAHPPLILLATSDDVALDIEAMLAGAAECVARGGLDGHTLERAIRHAIDRAEAQRALAESEKRFRTLVENSTDAIALIGPDHTILYASRAAHTILGRPPGEVLGAEFLGLVLAEDAPQVRARFARAVEARELAIEWNARIVRKDTTIRQVEGTAVSRLAESSVRALVLNFRDVTYRKWIERELMDSEERFHRMIDTVPVQIWIDDTERQLIFANRTTLDFTGHTLDQDLGDGWMEAVHPDDLANFQETYRAAAERREPFHVEYRVRRRDGCYRWLLETGVPRFDRDGSFAGYMGSETDITELREASEALRRSEERYRAFVTHSSEAIWRFELHAPLPIGLPETEQVSRLYAAGSLAECNAGMARMYGVADPSELAGAQLGELFPADDPANLDILRQFIRGGYRLTDAESRRSDAQGSLRTFRNNLVGIVENGCLVRAWGTQRDVTDLRGLEDQLRQSQKMEASGRLAGGIAHDFNNLLTAILGTSDLLLDDLGADDPHRDDIEEIKRAATRAATLTRQLLAFSRRQVLQPKVVDLNVVLNGTEKMLRRLIGEDVILLTRFQAELGAVKADPGQLEQVIMNLAVNARDAMPQGGTLVLETSNADAPAADASPPLPPGRYVRLSVADSGVGMTPEVQRHLFEPFFTTKEPGKGTGLGLATVYGIVKQSGGFVYALSAPGKGSTFTIYLPRVEGMVESGEPAPPPPDRVRAQGTVLLVEDEEAVRRLTRRVLEGNGYKVLEAENGADALRIVAQFRGPIRLLLTDVIMPGMSGQELARQLLGELRDLKVLFVSGYTDDTILQHGGFPPNTAFLQKPFTPVALSSRVREVLGD